MCKRLKEPPEQLEYRNSLGKFPTGVAIVTSKDRNNELIGMTINSFCSISLSPALVSWCLDRRSRQYMEYVHADRFTLSVLAEDQSHIARRLSRGGSSKFDGIINDTNSSLIVPGSCASFSCDMYNQIPIGDHLMLIGRVTDFESSQRQPLVFAQSNYQEISRARTLDAYAA